MPKVEPVTRPLLPPDRTDWRTLWTPGSSAFWMDPDLFWPVADPWRDMCWMLLDQRPAPPQARQSRLLGLDSSTSNSRGLFNSGIAVSSYGQTGGITAAFVNVPALPPMDAYYRMVPKQAKEAALFMLAKANQEEGQGDAAEALKLRTMATLILRKAHDREAP